MKVPCDICGEEFNKAPSLIKKHKHNYCSPKCRVLGYSKYVESSRTGKKFGTIKVKVNCNTCGEKLERYPKQIAKQKYFYCSASCATKDFHKLGIIKKERKIYNCKECGKEVDRKNKSGCCKVCYYKLGLSSGKNSPVYVERVIVKCDCCGSDIKKKPKDIYKHNFCNQRCLGLWMAEVDVKDICGFGVLFKVEDSSDKKKLRKYLRQCGRMIKWRRDVLERDGYVCQECEAEDCLLEAHHEISFNTLIEKYQIDSVKKAFDCKELWDINNGITLCLFCHANKHERCKDLILIRA